MQWIITFVCDQPDRCFAPSVCSLSGYVNRIKLQVVAIPAVAPFLIGIQKFDLDIYLRKSTSKQLTTWITSLLLPLASASPTSSCLRTTSNGKGGSSRGFKSRQTTQTNYKNIKTQKQFSLHRGGSRGRHWGPRSKLRHPRYFSKSLYKIHELFILSLQIKTKEAE